MAFPSAVVLYIHRSVNTVIEAVFCTTPFAAILQVQIHQHSIRLLIMLGKSCSGEAAGAITQHPHTRTTSTPQTHISAAKEGNQDTFNSRARD